ncbi:unnamed protein product [Symbiodinium sp. CCMP2456]|nr:unnamed protein product [Symbiodinium sp. CCMP2456]
MEANIWGVVAQEAGHGSGLTPTEHNNVVMAPAVLLDPGFPDGEGIRRALPGYPLPRLCAMRRRAWQLHVSRLVASGQLEGGPEEPLTDSNASEVDLYLIQTDMTVPVPNHPVGMELPEQPYHRRVQFGVASRRRFQKQRPAPRLFPLDDVDNGADSEDVNVGGASSSSRMVTSVGVVVSGADAQDLDTVDSVLGGDDAVNEGSEPLSSSSGDEANSEA